MWVTEPNMILQNKSKMYQLQISIKLTVSSKVINNNIRDSFSEWAEIWCKDQAPWLCLKIKFQDQELMNWKTLSAQLNIVLEPEQSSEIPFYLRSNQFLDPELMPLNQLSLRTVNILTLNIILLEPPHLILRNHKDSQMIEETKSQDLAPMLPIQESMKLVNILFLNTSPVNVELFHTT